MFPNSIRLASNPRSVRWIAIYVSNLYSVLMATYAFAFLSLIWANLAKVGQGISKKYFRIIFSFNVALFIGFLGATILVSSYSNDRDGYKEFNGSSLCQYVTLVTSASLVLNLAFVAYEGKNIANRLLQFRAVLGEYELCRVFSKLLICMCVIFTSIVLHVVIRIATCMQAAFIENMDILQLTIWFRATPHVFSILCLLYLQRHTTVCGVADSLALPTNHPHLSPAMRTHRSMDERAPSYLI
jgi:hypothetical protein